MQFKHPEILYALLLLIIPIIVHLFQLQRFTKTYFTNVKILKRIEQNTRKSARLKKWLVLCSRLMAFACLIVAFSQPYFSEYSIQQNFNTSIYLDNSFSMQSKGANGELLKSNAQNIIKNNSGETTKISLLTNDDFSPDLDPNNLKTQLITTSFSPTTLEFGTALLKISNQNSNESNSLYRTILISDFQNNTKIDEVDFTNVNSPVWLVKTTSVDPSNIFIDSLYINNTTSTEIVLKIDVKSSKILNQAFPIAVYNSNVLFGKTTVSFENSNMETVDFTIPNGNDFNGLISINDDNLEFDNDFYFTTSAPDKINVLSIGKSSDYLGKIFTRDEFNFISTQVENLNYNSIQNQQFIILNEIDAFPLELISNLRQFSKKDGNLLIIPSENAGLTSYNSLFNSLNIGEIISKVERPHKITTINYDHPIVKDVFERKVRNFSYPTINQYFPTRINNGSTIIQLDNNHTYISEVKSDHGNIYWVASPLSNDLPASIVVPLFYNFARNSLQNNRLYYTIGQDDALEIKAELNKDDVLGISNEKHSFIPLQEIFQNKVKLRFNNELSESGIYQIKNKGSIIKVIAFNYSREESNLNYSNIEQIANNHKNVSIASSIASIFDELNQNQKINWVFKWFLAFSVLFLLIEMLLLKYFKL